MISLAIADLAQPVLGRCQVDQLVRGPIRDRPVPAGGLFVASRLVEQLGPEEPVVRFRDRGDGVPLPLRPLQQREGSGRLLTMQCQPGQ